MNKLFIILLSFCFKSAYSTDTWPGVVHFDLTEHVLSRGTDVKPSFYFFSIPIYESDVDYDSMRWVSDTLHYKLYELPDEESKFLALDFYLNKYQLNLSVQKNIQDWFNPELLDGDDTNGYSNIYFVCKSRKGRWLEIIVDKESQKTLWIKEEKHIQFYTWKKLFAAKSFCVVRLKDQNSQIHQNPGQLSEIKKIDTQYCYNVDDVKGNWLFIDSENSEGCSENPDRLIEGWILFRDENGIKVEILNLWL